MRFTLLAMGLFGLSLAAYEHMPNLPDGRYLGAGSYSDNFGDAGDYQSYVLVSGNFMHTDYVWRDGDTTVNLAFWWHAEGYFDVAIDDYVVGKGFCMTHQCQYEMDIGEEHYVETLTFFRGYFLRFGYKKVGDHTVRWEENLRALDINPPDVFHPGSPTPGAEPPVIITDPYTQENLPIN
jgi:hypothetical protein